MKKLFCLLLVLLLASMVYAASSKTEVKLKKTDRLVGGGGANPVLVRSAGTGPFDLFH